MTEGTYQMADAYNEKKKSPTLWIILGILAVVVICCCCLVILTVLIIGIASFSVDPYFYFSPLLSLI
jgi:flagellar basal body-associated protein FliL